MATFQEYVSIARPDHWIKNVFVLPGIFLALMIEPATRAWDSLASALAGLLSVCLVASSNYVINEIFDAGMDRHHPLKCNRPIARGAVARRAAYVAWLLLAVAGLALAAGVSLPFLFCAVWLWLMGLVYNVPPLRSKDLPYLDVLSEAVNNPIRLLLGWYSVGAATFPPSSILLAYWMVGAYLMTAKRLAEYRLIGDPARAANYRASLSYYNEQRLITAMLSYASGFMFFVAVVVTKHHPELILACPFMMLYLAYYTKLAYEENSIAQTPEKLVTHKPLMAMTLGMTVLLLFLAVVDIPVIGAWLGLAGREW